MKQRQDKLLEILLALIIIMVGLAIASIATDLVLKIKNEGQTVNRFIFGK